MGIHEEGTNQLILEITEFVYNNGEFPSRGILSSSGKDMGKALTRYRSGEVILTKKQIELLSLLGDFLSQTEKNITELETYYQENGYLPFGEENRRFRDLMYTYKSGKVPITENQKIRLEKIGAFLDRTERMVRSIEELYYKEHRKPRRGDKTKEGYDMGSAIIGYRNGKRMITLNQKMRLEKIGIRLDRATIKEEANRNDRLVPPREKETLSEKIKKLKQEKESLELISIENKEELRIKT